MSPSRLLAAVVICACTAASTRTYAQSTLECAKAAESGQVLRDQRKLRAARKAFATCSKDACTAQIRVDCIGWLTAVESRLPEVVFVARDASGKDLVDVRVSVDGEVATERLSGASVTIDPGDHDVRFEAYGTSTTIHVVTREFEKGRLIEALLPRPMAKETHPEKPAPQRSRGVGPVTIGAGIVALGALASYAYFGLTSRSDLDRLRETCAPNCPSSEVETLDRNLLIANVSFAVGVLALTTTVVSYFLAPRDRNPSPGTSALRLGPP